MQSMETLKKGFEMPKPSSFITPKSEVSPVNLCLEILDLEDGYNWGRLVG